MHLGEGAQFNFHYPQSNESKKPVQYANENVIRRFQQKELT